LREYTLLLSIFYTTYIYTHIHIHKHILKYSLIYLYMQENILHTYNTNMEGMIIEFDHHYDDHRYDDHQQILDTSTKATNYDPTCDQDDYVIIKDRSSIRTPVFDFAHTPIQMNDGRDSYSYSYNSSANISVNDNTNDNANDSISDRNKNHYKNSSSGRNKKRNKLYNSLPSIEWSGVIEKLISKHNRQEQEQKEEQQLRNTFDRKYRLETKDDAFDKLRTLNKMLSNEIKSKPKSMLKLDVNVNEEWSCWRQWYEDERDDCDRDDDTQLDHDHNHNHDNDVDTSSSSKEQKVLTYRRSQLRRQIFNLQRETDAF
jgi:hypothetical protein